MWPSPRAFMPGTVAARQLSAPLMLTSSSASMSSGAASHEAVARTSAEALLTRMSASSPPSRLSTASRSTMSSASGRQPVSRGELAELVGRTGDGMDRRGPPIQSWRTVAAPMPRLAPVTMAVR